jgi:hypothetical protein
VSFSNPGARWQRGACSGFSPIELSDAVALLLLLLLRTIAFC